MSTAQQDIRENIEFRRDGMRWDEGKSVGQHLLECEWGEEPISNEKYSSAPVKHKPM